MLKSQRQGGCPGCYDNSDGADVDIICNGEVTMKYELTEERHSRDFCAQTTTNLEMDLKWPVILNYLYDLKLTI